MDKQRVWSLLAASACMLVAASAIQAVRSAGFLAVSDDDYARVVIAQEFARDPALDPTKTSWLPLPFWVLGAAMKTFGTTLTTARSVTLVVNAVCSGLLFALGRGLGWDIGLSCLVTLACCLLPSALWLGAATIPEFSTAALIATGSLSLLSPPSSKYRLLGAAAICVASASRYEAWPVALGIAGWNGRDTFAKTAQRWTMQHSTLVAGLVSLSFPGLWMIHGHLHHGDALFFVARVSHYHQALGLALPTIAELALGYPRALLSVEPWVVAGSVVALASATIGRRARADQEHVGSKGARARVLGILVLQLAVLVFGAAQGGAPTHHPERALLSVWFTLIGLSAHTFASRRSALRPVYVLGLTVLALAGSHATAPWSLRMSESRLRAPEEALGAELAAHFPKQSIGLATHDYGYLALMAAAGTPSRFEVWDRHDPRQTEAALPLQLWTRQGMFCVIVAPVPAATKPPHLEIVKKPGCLD